MSTDNISTNNREIDLIDLFKSIGDGIGNFFMGLVKAIAYLIIFGIRNWHYIIAIVVIGIGIGIVIANVSKPFYSSNMEAKTNGINSSDMIGYINNLHELCKDGNSKALAIELEMDDSTASKVKDIQAYYIVDINMDGIGEFVDFYNEIDLSDTTQRRLQDRIHVDVEVYDNEAFAAVRDGLLKYMRNNPYLLKLNEIRIRELEELIFQTNYELEKLDSLQNTDYFIRNNQIAARNNSQMMILAEKEPTMYYENKFKLLEQKHELQRELLLTTNAFTVIKDFTTLAVVENPKSMYVKKSVVFTFILGFFITLLLKNKKKVKIFLNIT